MRHAVFPVRRFGHRSRHPGTGAGTWDCLNANVDDVKTMQAHVWKDQTNLHVDIRQWYEKKYGITPPPLTSTQIGSWDPFIPAEVIAETKGKDTAASYPGDTSFVQGWLAMVSDYKAFRSSYDESYLKWAGGQYSACQETSKYDVETRSYYEAAKKRMIKVSSPPTPSDAEVDKATGATKVPWTGILVVVGLGATAYALSQVRQIAQVF